MPNYAKPAARIGTAIGLGGSALASLSDALDKPRRWLWQKTIGTDSGTEALGRLGLDTSNPLVRALGTGAEIVFDPLNLVGGIATKGLARLGRAVGRGLEAAAVARGPRFGGDSLGKIFGAPGLPAAGERSPHLTTLMGSLREMPEEALRRAGQELPEGSRFIGHGVEALAFRTPGGNVVRIAPVTNKAGRMARPDIPEMLPAKRAGLAGDIRVEHTPLAETLEFRRPQAGAARDPEDRLARIVQREIAEANPIIRDMKKRIAARGWNPIDIRPGNLGRLGGEVRVIDPGSVLPLTEMPPDLPQWLGVRQPGRFTNWLLDRIGSDRAIRRELGEL